MIGKKTARMIWMANERFTEAFYVLSHKPQALTNQFIDLLEEFTMLLYMIRASLYVMYRGPYF